MATDAKFPSQKVRNVLRIEKASFEDYRVQLKDKNRPPSKGGNTHAWHRHAIRIGGEVYSFLAPGSRKFAYKGETVSFEWDWDESKTYRNVERASIVAWKADGTPVIRGERGDKKWRTVDSRPPGRRSE